MGTGEVSSPAKSSKPTSTTQEAPPAPSYADWSASMQAYYAAGAAPPPFFTNTAASPAPHPYLWGGQHPIIPPYGAPVPYPAFYPPGGICAHPNMPMIRKHLTPSAANANMEMVEKTIEGKGQISMKKSNIISGVKAGESGKATSGSGNDGASRSAESGSEGSSDASDENNDHQESAGTKKGSFNQMLADGANAQNGTVNENIQTPVQGQLVASMPATNLNIGMELWNASPAGIGAVKMRPNPSGISPTVTAPTMVGREIQDERELKRQKRKQSNRESARRSRLRKQAECEELQSRVETLSTENHTLRDELQKLSEECEKLTSENNSIKDELTRICGPDALSNKDDSDSTPVPQSCCGGEGKS